MTREEFCVAHWDYYMVLEKDFLETERYLTIELGDNYLYDTGAIPSDPANSLAFSVEFIKQYQAICSEVDVIMKSICTMLGNANANTMPQYTSTIFASPKWSNIGNQKVQIKEIELHPFKNWAANPYNPPAWWPLYNDVKHKRLSNLREANLKNVVNALAGLYVLENYFVKYIAGETGDIDVIDVPSDKSYLFQMINWKTIWTVSGKDEYAIPEHAIKKMFAEK